MDKGSLETSRNQSPVSELMRRSKANPPAPDPRWTTTERSHFIGRSPHETGLTAQSSESQACGGESLWDENGGEWRYFSGDNYRYPHWDYKPHDCRQNIPSNLLTRQD